MDPELEVSDRPSHVAACAHAFGVADMLPIAFVLWIGSAVRVVFALAHHEVFDNRATLALACVVLVPWALWLERARAELRARSGSRRPRADTRADGSSVRTF